MPKWHGLDSVQGYPQELKTTKKVHTSHISRLTPCAPQLIGVSIPQSLYSPKY